MIVSTLAAVPTVDTGRLWANLRAKRGLSTPEKANVYTRVYGSVDTNKRANSVTYHPVYTVYTQIRKLQEKGYFGDSMGGSVDSVDTGSSKGSKS